MYAFSRFESMLSSHDFASDVSNVEHATASPELTNVSSPRHLHGRIAKMIPARPKCDRVAG